MSLLVKHPQHGIGATAGASKLQGRIRVRFANERVFDLPFDALDVLPASEIVGKLPRADRAFVSRARKVTGGAVLKPSRGLPGESVLERLGRRLMVGVIRNDMREQKVAYAGFLTVARRVAWKKQTTGEMSYADAAANVLTDWLSGRRKYDIKYFPRYVLQTMADDARKAKATKRGGKVQFVDVSKVEYKLSPDKLPGRATAAKMTPDRLGEKRARAELQKEFRRIIR